MLMWLILLARPAFSTAATLSPPPMMVIAPCRPALLPQHAGQGGQHWQNSSAKRTLDWPLACEVSAAVLQQLCTCAASMCQMH